EQAGGKSFPDFYNLPSPSVPIKIGPDMGAATLEGMIGMSVDGQFRPVFGDHEFLTYFANTAGELKLGLLVEQAPKSSQFSEIIDLGAPLTAQDLYKYASDQKFFAIVRRVSEVAIDQRYQNEKEVIISAASLTIDSIAGSPVTGVPKLAYDAMRAAMR